MAYFRATGRTVLLFARGVLGGVQESERRRRSKRGMVMGMRTVSVDRGGGRRRTRTRTRTDDSDGRMDGWTDGWLAGWKDGRMAGWLDRSLVQWRIRRHDAVLLVSGCRTGGAEWGRDGGCDWPRGRRRMRGRPLLERSIVIDCDGAGCSERQRRRRRRRRTAPDPSARQPLLLLLLPVIAATRLAVPRRRPATTCPLRGVSSNFALKIIRKTRTKITLISKPASRAESRSLGRTLAAASSRRPCSRRAESVVPPPTNREPARRRWRCAASCSAARSAVRRTVGSAAGMAQAASTGCWRAAWLGAPTRCDDQTAVSWSAAVGASRTGSRRGRGCCTPTPAGTLSPTVLAGCPAGARASGRTRAPAPAAGSPRLPDIF